MPTKPYRTQHSATGNATVQVSRALLREPRFQNSPARSAGVKGVALDPQRARVGRRLQRGSTYTGLFRRRQGDLQGQCRGPESPQRGVASDRWCPGVAAGNNGSPGLAVVREPVHAATPACSGSHPLSSFWKHLAHKFLKVDPQGQAGQMSRKSEQRESVPLRARELSTLQKGISVRGMNIVDTCDFPDISDWVVGRQAG